MRLFRRRMSARIVEREPRGPTPAQKWRPPPPRIRAARTAAGACRPAAHHRVHGQQRLVAARRRRGRLRLDRNSQSDGRERSIWPAGISRMTPRTSTSGHFPSAPQSMLDPGEYLIVFASSKNGRNLHRSGRLPAHRLRAVRRRRVSGAHGREQRHHSRICTAISTATIRRFVRPGAEYDDGNADRRFQSGIGARADQRRARRAVGGRCAGVDDAAFNDSSWLASVGGAGRGLRFRR